MNQYNQLTEGQRYQVSALLKAKTSQKEIALILGVSSSTISRELERNTGKQGYRPKQAQIKAERRREGGSFALRYIGILSIFHKLKIKY